MKKTLSLAVSMVIAVTGVFAKENPGAAGTKTTKGANTSITYSQPTESNGKLSFNTMELTVDKNCHIGGNHAKLSAGTYTVTTRPAGGEWVFVISKPSPEGPTAANTVLSTWALTSHNNSSVKSFTITSNASGLLMQKNNVSVALPLEFED